MKYEYNQNEIEVVDIHDMSIREAETYLQRILVKLPKEIKEIVVIHGFNRGKKLRDMVRKDLRSRRIKRRIISLNDGRTSLILE